MRQFPGKYADLIEEWLHKTAIDEDNGFGDVASPVGYVWKLDINEDAIEHEAAYLESAIARWFEPWWLVIENDQGQVFYQAYASEESRDDVAQKLSEEYDKWADDDPDSPGELADQHPDIDLDHLLNAAASLNDQGSLDENPEYLRGQVELICDLLPGGTGEWRESVEAAIKERIQ